MTPTFDEAYRAHANYVLVIARRAVGDTDAPDVAQEVWLRAARALGEFRGDANVRSWLHRITLNVIADRARMRGRRPDAYLVALDFAAGVSATAPTPERLASDAAERRQIRDALRALSPRLRDVMCLRFGGDTLEEIAARTHLPLGTVKSRVYRGYAAVGRRLQRKGIHP